MRRSRFTALVLLTALITGKVGITRPAEDQDVRGTWEIVSVERSGTLDPTPIGNTVQLVGNEVRFTTPIDGLVNAPSATVTKIDPKQLERLAFS
jgi:hypothetical protein